MKSTPKNLFLILCSDDWNILKKHIPLDRTNVFFVWHADLGSQELDEIKRHGQLYVEADFLTFSERKSLDTQAVASIKSLFSFKKECAYQGISWVDVLFYELRFLFTIHMKLNAVLPLLYERVIPSCVYRVKRKNLECETVDVILKSLGIMRIKNHSSLKTIFGCFRRESFVLKMSDFMKSMRYQMRRIYRTSHVAMLQDRTRVMFLGNVSHDRFDEALRICQKEGFESIKVVRSLSAHQKDKKNTFCIETLYAQYLPRAKHLSQMMDLDLLWDHFFKEHSEYSRNIWKPLVKYVNYELKKRCLDLYVSYCAFDALLESVPVQGILVWNDNLWWERLLVLMARQRGIRTHLFLHGIWSDLDEEFEMLICDSIGVWGQFPREQAIAKGIAPERLQVVGHPSFDRLLASVPSGAEADSFRSKRPRVLLITSPPPEHRIYCAAFPFEESRRMQECVCEATRDLDVDLILKTRGAKDTKRYEEWVRSSDLSREIDIVYQVPMVQLLQEADVVIAYESTAILEAMMLQKPVILLDVTGTLENCFYWTEKAVLYATDEISLKEQIEQVLHNPALVEELKGRADALLKSYTNVGLGTSDLLLAEWLLG